MNAPGKYLAKNLSITFNQTISQIFREDDKWYLRSLDNGTITQSFDYVVLAIPAPQVTSLTASVDHAIAAISSSLHMQGCWTVMAKLPGETHMPFDAAFINNEIISWMARNNSKLGRTGQESWTMHANPQWSQQWIELDKEEVCKQIIACAEKLGLPCKNADISIHRWRYASGATHLEDGCILNETNKLGLCGDWLNGGRVEGAWLSGYQLASAINASEKLLTQ